MKKQREAAILAESKAIAEAEGSREASEAKSSFLSTVYHELRTPHVYHWIHEAQS